MRISDWSSDVCSSDLGQRRVGWGSLRRSAHAGRRGHPAASTWALLLVDLPEKGEKAIRYGFAQGFIVDLAQVGADPVLLAAVDLLGRGRRAPVRSEEHTSELQSLMRISYAVFCLKKNNQL